MRPAKPRPLLVKNPVGEDGESVKPRLTAAVQILQTDHFFGWMDFTCWLFVTYELVCDLFDFNKTHQISVGWEDRF